MKALGLIIGLTMLLCGLATGGLAATRVAVVDFTDETGMDMAGHVVGGIVERLIAHPEFDVYERNRLKYILDEQGLQQTGLVSENQAVDLGKLAGVQYIITGQVTQATLDQLSTPIPYLGLINQDVARVSFHVDMIDVATGQIINTKTSFDGKKTSTSLGGMANNEGLLYKAADIAVEGFMLALNEKYPIIGKIVETASDYEIYINLGSKAGMKRGQKLTVYSEDRPIMSDGQVIGVRRTKVGEVKILEVQPDMCVCASGDFEKIKKGDKVTPQVERSVRRRHNR